jgi:hypothetical protein
MNIFKLFGCKENYICCPRADGKPEWTPWERKTKTVERPRTTDDNDLCDETITVLKYNKIWQERQCATCGKIFQESLDY